MLSGSDCLMGGTVLCPCVRHFILYLVLVKPMKRPNMTTELLTGS